MITVYRAIDRVVGAVLCGVLGPLLRIIPVRDAVPRRILVLRLWGAGDAVVSLPALYALKQKYPHSTLSVLVTSRTKTPYERQQYIDNVIVWDVKKTFSLFFSLRHYDLVVDLEQYLNLSALVALWLGKRRIGFDHGIRRLCYTDTTTFSRERHMLLNYLGLTGLVGAKYTKNTLLPLQVTAEDKKYIDTYLKSFGVSGKDLLIGICCTVAESGKTRLWDDIKFAWVADELARRYKAKIVFIGGQGAAADNEKVIAHMQQRAINASATSLRQAFDLFSRFDLMISLDTGPMHMAAAQGVPTVGIFGPNTPDLWAPYGPNNISVYKRVPCSPCILNEKGRVPSCLRVTDKNLCMTSIEPADVLTAAEKLLATNLKVKHHVKGVMRSTKRVLATSSLKVIS